ncbi:MAG: hypothetical protein NC319_08205 [Butyricicoccus sp.]|nr:hypothetical protein [Butyricicoccus sp.]
MLRKLFKYEFGATGRIFLPMYAALLLMSLVSHFFYNADVEISGILFVLVTMLMVMLFTAVWVVTLVVVVRRFYSNLLGREGYLMNVLPVDPWQHVLAKTGTSAVWIIAGMIVSLVSMLAIFMGLPEFGWSELREVFSSLREGIGWLSRNGYLGQTVLFFVELIAELILETCQFVLMAYAAMCIGQLASRHRVWASIGAYFGIQIAESFVTQLLGEANFDRILDSGEVFRGLDSITGANIALGILLAETLVMCAAMFFVSSVLLKKKLNLQ